MCTNGLAICTNTQLSPAYLFSNLFICSGFYLVTIVSPTHSGFVHGHSHLCSQLVPLISATTPQSHAHSCSHPLTPSTSLPSFPVTHFPFLSCLPVTHCTSSLSLPFINPLDDTVPHLTSLFILHNSLWLRLPSPSLYRLPPPIPIKDLRAPLSANQVVIRAAKIRGLINKGLSLLASGSLCLNRWHWSAFWVHQIDARTPGVPWNGEQRQSLALANNAGIGSLLPIFRGTLPRLVLHSPHPFFPLFLSSR